MTGVFWCDGPILPNITSKTKLADLFTPCLIFTTIPLVPLAFAIISFLIVICYTRYYVNQKLDLWSSKIRLKLVNLITSLFCSIIGLFLCLSFDAPFYRERRIFYIVDVLFCLLALSSYRISLKFGYITDGWLHLAWLLRSLSFVPISCYLFYELLTVSRVLNVFLTFFGLIEFICASKQVILLYYPDTQQRVGEYERLNDVQERSACPFQTSSAVQNGFQIYAGPLLRKSFKQKVTCDNDFWQLEKEDQAVYIRSITAGFTGSNNSMCDLIWLLARVSWLHNLKALLNSNLTSFSPVIYYFCLSYIIEFCSGSYPIWLAVFPAVGLFLSDLTKNTANKQMFLHGNLSYFNIRSALTGLVFDKMLKLSPSSQISTATGVILNYVTVDIIHSRTFFVQLYNFLYCPIVIITSLTVLTFQVGVHNMAYGLVVLLIFQTLSLMLTRLDSIFTEKQMKYKDERLKLINDILNGCKILKLYGWESSMQRIVSKIRSLEAREVFKYEMVTAIVEMLFSTAPSLASLATLYGYVIRNGQILTPKSAFVVVFLFDLICFSVYRLPQLVTSAITTFISMRRVLNFLNQPEREEPILEEFKSGVDEFIVEINNASYSWLDSSDNINLSDINLSIRPGQLVAVMGSVGSGKSTLLAAIANELKPLFGTVNLRSNSMAYVPQQAWIQNMSLRDNILFESDFNADFYEKTLDACALRDDIQLLPGGDLTEIGEKGINLSGGQKARVSLARAVYQQADFYILDDPLSAVDSHVGHHLFNNVIANGGLLDGKTRIVAINSKTFLQHFDIIICLKGEKISYCGPYSGLYNESSASLSSQVLPDESEETKSREKTVKERTSLLENEYEEESLIEEENFNVGRIPYRMYSCYIKEFGLFVFALFFLCQFVLFTSARVFASLYMANWSVHALNITRLESAHSLIIYGSLSFTGDCFFAIAFLFVGIGCYRASTRFHSKFMESILRAPISFFEKTPLGRIMNRFSMDVETLDTSICQNYHFLFMGVSELIRLFVSIFIATPLFSPVVIPLIIVCIFLTRYFNAASAQFRHIASHSMSKVCSAIQDAYNGASSIRVYKAVQRFRNEFAEKLDRTVESNSVEIIASCWVQNRMDIFAEFTVLVCIIGAIWSLSNGWINLGLLGMIASFSVSIGGMFGDLTNLYRDSETELVSIERIKEYIDIENEPIWKSPVKAQPSDSSVEFKDVSLRYREQDAAVINKVSFRVESGQKIGIVGRTGAGKTSLTSLLFRLVEPFEGNIRIGGVDICNLGPNLRQILSIIPQDPVLFCGTLRSNLDPFEEFTNQQLWNALEKAHLSEFAHSLDKGLDYEIAEGGNNLSVGQRQLACLARALLRTTSILVLDEATAAVDHDTDNLIQQTIRENFSTCTILTIAHRLNTVMDSDKILLIEAGRVAEFDSPSNLLANSDSLFYGFAKTAELC